jgi:hypothetical protein
LPQATRIVFIGGYIIRQFFTLKGKLNSKDGAKAGFFIKNPAFAPSIKNNQVVRTDKK